MLDKQRFTSELFAHSHNAAEGTILQRKNQRLGSHKIPSAFWSDLYTYTHYISKIQVFFFLATLPHTRQSNSTKE